MTLDKVKLKTINNQSVIGDGNISVGGSSVDIVTSWSSTTSDSKVPSEKLAKDSLDGKANSSHTHNNITNDGKVTVTGTSGGNMLVTNSSNEVIVDTTINVMDNLVQQLITYGSS